MRLHVGSGGRRSQPTRTSSLLPPAPQTLFSSVPPSCQTLYNPRDCTDSQSFSIRVFSNESALCIRWPKYWSFSFNISPSSEHPGLSPLGWTGWISSLPKGLSRVFQHHSSKASILPLSAFFVVQLSHPYMTTGKTIALTTQTLSVKKCFCFLIMLSRLVIPFLPRSKHSFNFTAAVTICSGFGAQENNEIPKS